MHVPHGHLHAQVGSTSVARSIGACPEVLCDSWWKLTLWILLGLLLMAPAVYKLVTCFDGTCCFDDATSAVTAAEPNKVVAEGEDADNDAAGGGAVPDGALAV